MSTLAGSPGSSGSVDGTGASAQSGQPYGIAVNGAGILYVADYLGYSVRQAQLAPVLQYTAVGQQLVLSWPLRLTGFLPQVTTSLPPVLWTPLPTNGLVTSGDYWVLTNAAGSGPSFFRLAKQIP